MKKVLYPMCVATFWLLLVPAIKAQQPSEAYWLGKMRGAYPTGTTSMLWIDASRDEVTTSEPQDKRHVMVQMWYPALNNASAERAPYAQDITLYDQGLQDIFKSMASRLTQSRRDAPLSSSKTSFPVIVYSHGGDAQIFSGTFVTEFLASHGYIVMSVGHTDDSRLERFPDGTTYLADNMNPGLSDETAATMSQMEVYAWMVRDVQARLEWRTRDITFALDRLQEIAGMEDNLFHQKVDVERVGAIGWSRGGASALQSTVVDERIHAAVNLDGTVFGQSVETEGSTRPLLMLENAAFIAPPAAGTTDADKAELTSAVQSYTWGMFRRSSADWYYATLSGTNHHSFSDYILAYETLPAGILDPAYIHNLINEMVLEFFEKYLNGRTDSSLLDGLTSYPELKINRSAPLQ